MRSKRWWSTLLTAGLLLTLTACSKRETVFITPWFKVLKLQPKMDSGIVRIGDSSETAYVKAGWRWTRLGRGNMGLYRVMDGGNTVMFDLQEGGRLRLIRKGEREARPLSSVLGLHGEVVAHPQSGALDLKQCVKPGDSLCKEMLIHRFDPAGRPLETLRVVVPQPYTDCRLAGIAGYDQFATPYLSANCGSESQQAKCLLVGAQKENPFLHVVGLDRDWRECGEWRIPISLFEPRRLGIA